MGGCVLTATTFLCRQQQLFYRLPLLLHLHLHLLLLLLLLPESRMCIHNLVRQGLARDGMQNSVGLYY
jgi:hypothetical protein